MVWALPKFLVCLHCGFTELNVPELELHVLAENLCRRVGLIGEAFMTALASTGGRKWRELYRTALFELDEQRLPSRIAEAERALLLRERDLFGDGWLRTLK